MCKEYFESFSDKNSLHRITYINSVTKTLFLDIIDIVIIDIIAISIE